MRRPRASHFISLFAGVALALLSACHLQRTGPALPPQATGPAVVLDSTMGPLDSQQALSRGPLMLVFYRGHW